MNPIGAIFAIITIPFIIIGAVAPVLAGSPRFLSGVPTLAEST
jgi:hypothetical protein